jgi:C1A family cysteine protease
MKFIIDLKSQKVLISVFVFMMITYSIQDIPTHCLKSQVVGDWVFQRGPLSFKTKEELFAESSLCGHKLPSHESTSIEAKYLPNIIDEIQVHLDNDDSVVILGDHNDISAKWTMVYDEGFDIVANKENPEKTVSYFAFLKYAHKKEGSRLASKFASYCYITLNGWYHIGNKWGCFQGKKILPNGQDPDHETNGEATNKQNITENSIVSSFFQLDDKLNIDVNLSKNKEKSVYPNYSNNDNTISNSLLNSINSVFQNFKFTEIKSSSRTKAKSKFTETITLHANFKDHASVVERINESNLTWSAAVYKEFEGKTIAELNEFAGKKKSTEDNLFLIKRNSSYNNQKKNLKKLKKARSENNTKSLDLSHLMTKAKSQGSCGSCYAAATITSLEARLRKTNRELLADDKFKISLDHILECSVYNQGCDGGYSYLTLKFGHENGLLNHKCYKKLGGCKSSCNSSLILPTSKYNDIIIKDYYYLGGSYGRCDEQSMIEELDKNGPFVISFEPSYTFMMYKQGIFQGTPAEKSWMDKKQKKPEWTKVDHSVVLVGYGVDEKTGTPFWKCQNSWGANWGENGYFRIVRGKDYAGIESICEAGLASFK